MFFYDVIENIKDLFRGTVNYKITPAIRSEDIRLLRDMANVVRYIKASNGKCYLYYRLRNEQDLAVAQYLFRRNGINMKRHYSKMSYYPQIVLRMRQSKIMKNPGNEVFIERVMAGQASNNVPDIQIRIDDIRASMGKRQR